MKVLSRLPPPDDVDILPNKLVKKPKLRKRHKSDDTDFLLQPIDISVTLDNRPQSALSSDPRKDEYDDIDGYRMYKYRPKESQKICGKYPPASDPEYELLHFSGLQNFCLHLMSLLSQNIFDHSANLCDFKYKQLALSSAL